MSIPSNSDFTYYTATPLTNTDWTNNFHQVITFLTNAGYDFSIKTLTTAGAITCGGALTVSGTLTIPGYTLISGYLAATFDLAASSAWQNIPFNTESFDVLSEFNTTTYTFTATATGYYRITLYPAWYLDSFPQLVDCRILHNAAELVISSLRLPDATGMSDVVGRQNSQSIVKLVALTALDTIKFQARTNVVATNAHLTGASNNTFFTIERLI